MRTSIDSPEAAPAPHSSCAREYIQDMAAQLSDLARSAGLEQAAAYLALASLAVRSPEPFGAEIAGTLKVRRG